MAAREHFYAIQILRAFAALLVVVFHMTSGTPKFLAAGVDIFFVISGFIIGKTDIGDSPLRFLTRRLLRIVPLYWAVTLALCLIAVLSGLSSQVQVNPEYLTKSLLFIPYVNQVGEVWPLLVPGWTLNYEILFYALFFIGLCFSRPKTFTLMVLPIIVLAGLFLRDNKVLTFITSPVILEFGSGVVLSIIYRQIPRVAGLPLLVVGLVLFFGSEFIAFGINDWQVLYTGVPAFMIVSGALTMTRHGAGPAWAKPLEFLGDASYSLYLTHGLVLSIGHRLLGDALWAKPVLLLMCVAAGALCYVLFERPVTKGLNGWVGRHLFRQTTPRP
ncbi:acyltransferase [Asticcacaulis sp. AND118]|uniref:acyltransferase family protein n=1 Tax=Asticcacaulis sp. AND118 TaxID=2840468 RepID=UPI001CFFFAB7|nr:acyltransferase [Asticcacaulis sp. AND118]UDF05052.1 acyltransferase [Asticcacaulis sp. AND118]